MSDPFSDKLHNLYQQEKLPEHDYLFNLADRTASVLENEDASYRPYTEEGKPGALLDFMKAPPLPLVVVPDLHARSYFLLNVLDFIPPAGFLDSSLAEHTILEALEQGGVRVVCVGDALHAEQRAKERWQQSWQEFNSGATMGPAVTAEMAEGLTLLSMVMECKCRIPQAFHFIKGNHENILNRRGGGDFPFCKFANEGEQVRCFMRDMYGDDVLHVISCFEKELPVAAVFPRCLVSHAEPRRAFTRQELIDARNSSETVFDLTWTENDAAKEGGVKQMLDTVSGGSEEAVYLAGHRPVQGNYALRQKGLFIQIHNTECQNVALVYPEKKFNPDTDIVPVVSD